MGKRRNSKTDRELNASKRRALVISLRRAGATYEQIADECISEFGIDNLPLGWDSRYAYNDLKRVLEKAKAETEETAEEIKSIELARLDEMHSRVYPVALGSEEVPPDMRAVDRVLSIGKRRAELLGLDKPIKQDVSYSFADTSDDELIRQGQALFAEVEGLLRGAKPPGTAPE